MVHTEYIMRMRKTELDQHIVRYQALVFAELKYSVLLLVVVPVKMSLAIAETGFVKGLCTSLPVTNA
jgi:hypothetical protein